MPDPLPSFDPLSTDNIQRAYDDHQQNLDLNKKPSCCNRDVFAYCTTKSHCSCLRAGVDCRDCCSYNGCCLNRENPIPATTTTTTTTKNVPRTKKPGKPKSCTHDKARGGFLFRPTTPATVAAEVGKIREAQSLVAADLSKQIETKIPSTSSDDDGIIGIIRKNIEIENSATNNNNNNSIETQSAVGGPSNPITVVVSDYNPRAHTAAGRGRDRGRSEAAGRGRSASGRDAGRGGRDGGRGRGRSVVGRGDGGQSGR